MADARWVEVEGDKPKVERTRRHFAAIFAGLRIAEEYAREQERELDALAARLAALEQVAEAWEAKAADWRWDGAMRNVWGACARELRAALGRLDEPA